MNTREAKEAMLAKIAKSGLDGKDAKKSKFSPLTSEQLVESYPNLTTLPAAGFRIPYFDRYGKETEFFRYRYLEEPKRRGFDAITQHKAMRYIQPAGAEPRVYFSPLCDWSDVLDRKEDRIIFITEGELKAACAVKLGLPCLGIGGVWNFRSKKDTLIPDLAKINWSGTVVYIVYDSDAISNYQVVMAENALAKEVLNRGAVPYIIRLPKVGDDKKTGLDDFLVAKGLEDFYKLAEETLAWQQAKVLHELNEKVVFVHDPGNVLEIDSLQRMSAQQFSNSIYANLIWEERVETKNKTKILKKSAASEWVKWPARAEVKRTTYAPGEPRITEKGELNTWSGWGMTNGAIAKGNIKPWTELMAHLFSGEPQEHINWFQQWLAYPLQHPGTKLFSAVVLWGQHHGTGKSLVGYTMERFYGKNFAEIADRDLLGNFNEWAENKQFVMADEITGGDKRGSGDRMKSMITQRSLRINMKFIPSYTVPDCINYYFTSNHADSFFVEDKDRRYFIHEVRASPKSDAFYKEYDRWYKSPEVGALFYALLNLDLTGFNPNAKPPKTKSKEEMIEIGRSDIGAWVAQLAEEPDKVMQVGAAAPLKYSLMTTEELFKLYDPEGNKRITKPGLQRELRRAGFRKAVDGANIFTASGNQRLWIVRNREQLSTITNSKDFGKIYDRERAQMIDLINRKERY